MQTSKELTQQIELLITEWRKSNPSHYEVARVLETVATEVDNMDTLGHISVYQDKQIAGMVVQVPANVSINSVVLESLSDLCAKLEHTSTRLLPIYEFDV